MRFTRVRELVSGTVTYTLIIEDEEFRHIKLDRFDKKALEVFSRTDATIEERLMGLQIIAKRIEENA